MKLLNKLRQQREKELTEEKQPVIIKTTDEHESMFNQVQHYAEELMCPLEPHRTVW
jgi:hypothetical protein